MEARRASSIRIRSIERRNMTGCSFAGRTLVLCALASRHGGQWPILTL